jgi:primary-amine oxidase
MSPDGSSDSKPALSSNDHVTVRVQTTPKSLNHPLDPLSPNEVRYLASKPLLALTLSSKIATIALSIRHHIAANTELKAIKFITCTLLPPPKKAVLAFLGIPLSPGGTPDTPVSIVRKAEVDVSSAYKYFKYVTSA